MRRALTDAPAGAILIETIRKAVVGLSWSWLDGEA